MRTASGRRVKVPLTVVIIAVAAMVSIFTLAGCFKVVKIGDEGKLTGEKTFDATSTVDEFWDSKLMPDLKDCAVDLGTMLTECNGKPSSVADKYGRGDKRKVFTVSGSGMVSSVKEGQNGVLVIAPDGYTGDLEVKIQIGPIYEGTSIRDSLSFISVQDVANQVEWANLSKSINDKVASDVVSKVDIASATGKRVTFTGCFSGDNVLITPIELKLS